MSLSFRVAMELGTWRSGLGGGAPSAPTLGNGSDLDEPGFWVSRGGKGGPFGDQESIGGDAQGRMVMETEPPPAFVMTESQLLFEVLVVPLDPPALVGRVHQLGKRRLLGQGRQPEVSGLFGLMWPFDEEPFLRPGLATPRIALGRADANRREP